MIPEETAQESSQPAAVDRPGPKKRRRPQQDVAPPSPTAPAAVSRPGRQAGRTAPPTAGKPALLSTGGAVLAFQVADQRYGLPAASVIQIIEMVAITSLPGAPEVVAGVIDLHGRVIPLLDMRARLQQPPQPYTLRTPIIVTQLEDRLAGLVVDAVTGVVQLSPQQLQDPAQILAQELAPQPLYLAAVAPLPEGLVLVLDPGALLPQKEKRALSRALSRQQQEG